MGSAPPGMGSAPPGMGSAPPGMGHTQQQQYTQPNYYANAQTQQQAAYTEYERQQAWAAYYANQQR
eukprot:8999334-Pyramimonas_sp.AAC.1